MKAGGTLVASGSSSYLAEAMNLPVEDALLETDKAGKPAPISGNKFYIPGSLLEAALDPGQPLAYGMPDHANVFFENSPTYRVAPGATGVSRIAWYDDADPLRSGWAWGQKALDGTVGVVDASYGKGKVFLLGPEVAMRGQSYGTFKFVFNALEYGPAAAGKAAAPAHGN